MDNEKGCKDSSAMITSRYRGSLNQKFITKSDHTIGVTCNLGLLLAAQKSDGQLILVRAKEAANRDVCYKWEFIRVSDIK